MGIFDFFGETVKGYNEGVERIDNKRFKNMDAFAKMRQLNPEATAAELHSFVDALAQGADPNTVGLPTEAALGEMVSRSDAERRERDQDRSFKMMERQEKRFDIFDRFVAAKARETGDHAAIGQQLLSQFPNPEDQKDIKSMMSNGVLLNKVTNIRQDNVRDKLSKAGDIFKDYEWDEKLAAPIMAGSDQETIEMVKLAAKQRSNQIKGDRDRTITDNYLRNLNTNGYNLLGSKFEDTIELLGGKGASPEAMRGMRSAFGRVQEINDMKVRDETTTRTRADSRAFFEFSKTNADAFKPGQMEAAAKGAGVEVNDDNRSSFTEIFNNTVSRNNTNRVGEDVKKALADPSVIQSFASEDDTEIERQLQSQLYTVPEADRAEYSKVFKERYTSARDGQQLAKYNLDVKTEDAAATKMYLEKYDSRFENESKNIGSSVAIVLGKTSKNDKDSAALGAAVFMVNKVAEKSGLLPSQIVEKIASDPTLKELLGNGDAAFDATFQTKHFPSGYRGRDAQAAAAVTSSPGVTKLKIPPALLASKERQAVSDMDRLMPAVGKLIFNENMKDQEKVDAFAVFNKKAREIEREFDRVLAANPTNTNLLERKSALLAGMEEVEKTLPRPAEPVAVNGEELTAEQVQMKIKYSKEAEAPYRTRTPDNIWGVARKAADEYVSLGASPEDQSRKKQIEFEFYMMGTDNPELPVRVFISAVKERNVQIEIDKLRSEASANFAKKRGDMGSNR